MRFRKLMSKMKKYIPCGSLRITSIPCGSLRITSIPFTKYVEWIIVVHQKHGISISFVEFEMDYSSDSCVYTSLTLYQHVQQQWCYECIYCGRRLPFNQTLISNKVKLLLRHRNVLKNYNVSFNYMVYAKHNFYAISTFKTKIVVHIGYQSLVHIFKRFVINYIVLVHIELNKKLFMHTIVCSNLNMSIYDGPDHNFPKNRIDNCSALEQNYSISFIYHIVLPQWYVYEDSTNKDLKIHFDQKALYMKTLLPGVNNTVKREGKLTRIGFKLMDLVKNYYHIDVLTHVFFGINIDNCAFGCLYLRTQDITIGNYDRFKKKTNYSSLGPFCERSPTAPFVGKTTDIIFP